MNSQKTLPNDWKAVTSAAVLFTKSLLLGLDHATRRMEFDDEITDSMIENLPFEEAVEYLRKRNILSADEYYRLSDKMKFRAFTASRIADGDLLKKLNMKLTHALESGESLSDFKRWTRDDLLNAVGMGSTNFSYWETVYRTNVQTAYNAGRAMGFEEDKPIALEFIGIDDARTTEICRQLQNPKIILPYDDPFWDSHWPPLHFNCRSTVRGIYDEGELPESYIQPETTERPARGFGRFPLDTDDWWQELKGQAARAREYNVQREIERAFERLIATGGGSGGILDKPEEEQIRFADEYYEEIRNRKSQSDIKSIAKNTKMNVSDVSRIRDHIFIKKHKFKDGTISRFDSDVNIALAWQRLEQNNFNDTDLVLLKHELEELTIMKDKGYYYEKAHWIASRKYPWEFYLKGGYSDDKIREIVEQSISENM